MVTVRENWHASGESLSSSRIIRRLFTSHGAAASHRMIVFILGVELGQGWLGKFRQLARRTNRSKAGGEWEAGKLLC